MERRVKKLGNKLAIAEENLAEFMAANNIYIAEGHALLEKQLAREMEELVRARNDTAQSRARYEQARQMMRDGLGLESVSGVLASHSVRVMHEAYAKAERRAGEARTRLGPKHPTMGAHQRRPRPCAARIP